MAEQTDTTSFSSDEGDSNISYYQPISDCPSGEEQDEDSGEGFTYHPSTPANVEFDVDALVQQKLGIVDTPPTLNASVGPLDPEKERTLNKVALDEFDNRYKTQVEASIPSSSGANIHKLFNSFGELSAGNVFF